MHTFLRLTILGVFAAAGVAVAISLAMRTDTNATAAGDLTGPIAVPDNKPPSSKPRADDETAALAVANDEADLVQTPRVVPAAAVTEPPHETRVSDVVSHAPTAKSEAAPTQSFAPQSQLVDPLVQHIEKLTSTLTRMQEATVQSRIELLAAQVDRLTERSPPVAQDSEPTVEPTVVAAVPETIPAPYDTTVDSMHSHQPPIYSAEGDVGLTFNFTDADLREAINAVSREAELNVVVSENVKGEVSCSFNNVDAMSVLRALVQGAGYTLHVDGRFTYVGTPKDLEAMGRLSDEIKTRVYRTNYVTAAELQQLITPMLTQEVGVATVSTAAIVGIPASIVETGGDDFAGNEVVVVRDFEAVLVEIDKVVAQVDQRPKQVLIEAMILSVNLDDEHKFGINFELFKNSGTLALASGTPLASLGALDFSSGGLNFGLLRSGAGAFINALEQIGDTNVIAAPRLLCLNKQRAEILIGDQKGFISTTQTETSTTQSVEFLDIGTQLRIRPFISDDGVIRLEVHPELSTGDVKLIGEFALPEKSVTQVTTNIMCRDGCTVVLGGLIREDYAKQISQVSGVGNVPVFGALFRNKTENVTRNEIIVLITPRIIEDPAVADVPPRPDIFGRQSTIESRKINPSHRFTRIAARCHSDRYYRLAQTSWVAGNVQETLRYLDLSLDFNPRNNRAWHLRGVVSGSVLEYELSDEELPTEPPEPIPAREASNTEDAPIRQPGLRPATIVSLESIDAIGFETESLLTPPEPPEP